MARLIVEDIALYLMAFYLVCSVIFSAGLFNTFLPDQRYNTTTNSFEPFVATPTPSIFGNSEELNATLGQFGNTTSEGNPGGMLDPVSLVRMMGFYISFITGMVSSTMLNVVLTPFIGAVWASRLTFVINISITLVIIRVITGRLRWD